MTSQSSDVATDGRLEIHFEMAAGATKALVPMRTARLRFRNVTNEPLRIYLPLGEPFRATISTLVFVPPRAPRLVEPEPRPHGYVVTEEDFTLLAPGETRTFTQAFTVDGFAPGRRSPERRDGFARGSDVALYWTYSNAVERWEGGAQTLDGPTKALFGGERIPHIWLGKLTAWGRWRVDD